MITMGHPHDLGNRISAPGFQPAGNGFFGKATPPPVGCGTACPDAEEAQVELCQVPLRACHRMLGTDEGHLHSIFLVEKSWEIHTWGSLRSHFKKHDISYLWFNNWTYHDKKPLINICISCIPRCLAPQIRVPVLPSRMKMMALPSQTFSPWSPARVVPFPPALWHERDLIGTLEDRGLILFLWTFWKGVLQLIHLYLKNKHTWIWCGCRVAVLVELPDIRKNRNQKRIPAGVWSPDAGWDQAETVLHASAHRLARCRGASATYRSGDAWLSRWRWSSRGADVGPRKTWLQRGGQNVTAMWWSHRGGPELEGVGMLMEPADEELVKS